MLVLSRRVQESIIVDGEIRITVIGIAGNRVKLGIEAPASVRIVRSELLPEVDTVEELTPRRGGLIRAIEHRTDLQTSSC